MLSLCAAQPLTPLIHLLTGTGERSFVYTRLVHEPIFLFMFYDFWGAFWFYGFCVLLYFLSWLFSRVDWNTHWIFYIIINSKQEVESKETIYTIFISFLLSEFATQKYSSSQHSSWETCRKRTSKEISRRRYVEFSGVYTSKVALTSFLIFLLWLGSSRMKQLKIENRIKFIQIHINL